MALVDPNGNPVMSPQAKLATVVEHLHRDLAVSNPEEGQQIEALAIKLFQLTKGLNLKIIMNALIEVAGQYTACLPPDLWSPSSIVVGRRILENATLKAALASAPPAVPSTPSPGVRT